MGTDKKSPNKSLFFPVKTLGKGQPTKTFLDSNCSNPDEHCRNTGDPLPSMPAKAKCRALTFTPTQQRRGTLTYPCWSGVRGGLTETQDFHYFSAVRRPPSAPMVSVEVTWGTVTGHSFLTQRGFVEARWDTRRATLTWQE